jgi:hypothetical protein
MGALVLGRAGVRVEMLLDQILGGLLVTEFGSGQIAQKLAGVGVAGGLRGAQIERPGLRLHRVDFGTDRLEAQVFDQPDRTAGIEAGHMLAADQRDDLAKAALMQVDQTAAVVVLFLGHTVEDGGRGGVIGADPLGIAAVDATVVLFGRNGERQHLLFGQIGKAATRRETGDHGSLFLE